MNSSHRSFEYLGLRAEAHEDLVDPWSRIQSLPLPKMFSFPLKKSKLFAGLFRFSRASRLPGTNATFLAHFNGNLFRNVNNVFTQQV